MKQERPSPPLTPAVFYILLSLAAGEKHGYEIMKQVKDASGGSMIMGNGTLYGSIKRMLAERLIEDAGDRADPAGDERRRYYRLTKRGRAALGVEMRRLDDAIVFAKRNRLLPLHE